MRVVALDIGTTMVKALAVDQTGAMVGRHDARLPLHTDAENAATQPIDAVLRAAAEALRAITDGAPGGRVDALAVSGAMHSLAPIGADDRPLAEAMTWADRRAAAVADAMAAEVDDPDDLYRRSGCPWSTLYHPPRLRWWAARLPGVRRWVGIKDAALHWLTGRWATDASLASATGLLDIQRGAWDEQALGLAGVGAAELAELVEPTEVIGGLTEEAAEATGLAAGLPVVAGASDGALANVGAGAAVGETVVTVGTSAAVRRLVDRPRLHPRRRAWCYRAPGQRWLAGAAMNSGGIAVEHMLAQWYGDEAEPWKMMAREAGHVPVGSDGVMVMPFVSGERELVWPRDAGWRVEGFDRGRHGRGHVARATLEAVAMAVATLLDVAAELDYGTAARSGVARLTGGITRSPLWRGMLADVLGVSLRPVEAADASAMGAAALALGAMDHPRPASFAVEGCGVIRPNPEHHAAYGKARRRWIARCRQLGWWLD